MKSCWEEYRPSERVTYKMIKEYIESKYGFKVHTAYIAEVKRGLGLPMYDAPNAVEELKQPRKHPTPKMVEAIKDALKYFQVILKLNMETKSCLLYWSKQLFYIDNVVCRKGTMQTFLPFAPLPLYSLSYYDRHKGGTQHEEGIYFAE